MKITRKRKCSILFFTIVLFSLACSPPTYIYDSIEKIYIDEEKIFLSVSEINGYLGHVQNDEPKIFYSENEGRSWGLLSESNDFIKNTLSQRPLKETQVCTHIDPSTCFRITGQEEIQISTDGGKSWKVDWDETRNRKSFLDRDMFIRNNKNGADTIPMDIGLLEGDNEYKLFVTLGTQGILVRDMKGKYLKYSVTKDNKPLSVRTNTFSELIETISSEVYVACIVSLLHFLIASLLIWRSLFGFYPKGTKIHLKREKLILWVSVSLFLSSFIVAWAFNTLTHIVNEGYEPLYVGVIPIIFWLVTFFSIMFSWIFMIKKMPTIKSIKEFFISTLLFSGLIILVCVSPFGLWATGIITQYEIALSLSAILVLVTVILNGFRQMNTLQVSRKYSENL